MIKNVLVAFFIVIGSITLNAKVIEVQQLFNKKIIKVKNQELFSKKTFYGTTKIDESKVFDVVTRFNGYITKLNANKNFMFVDKNSVLFSVYSDEILSIQKELKISKELNKNAYKSTLLKLNSLDINKDEIERIKQNRVSYNGINIYSNSNAIVLEKTINNGGYVKKGNRLMSLVNIEKLWFIAKVYQSDLKYIKKDSTAKIFIEGLDKTIISKVDFIYPYANEDSKTVNVRFVIDNKDLKIYPNMFGKIDIKLNQRRMLTLPKTAVLNKGSKYYVFKNLSATEFEPVEVQVNRINSNTYEILEGLNQNDEVINNALFLFDSDAITNMLYDSDSDDDW